ncbi:MAG: UDP-N-acetylmuramate dehydrogenase [Actinobacteria bacterium]|nr:UDP-N-acetylmuramate dehydrogenase [Actinomycetota bacterium]
MNLSALASQLSERAHGTVQTDYPLAGLTTYRVGGPARVYFEPADRDDIAVLAEVVESASGVPMLVLGRGSNLVVADSGFPGVVVRLGMAFSWVRSARPEEDGTKMVAGSATPLPLLANWAARRGLAGVEFAVAIPGSVGGGVRMNAGAHGGEIVDTLRSATLFDVRSGALAQVPVGDLGMTYRYSQIHDHQIVLDATFELMRDHEDAVRARMESYRKHRAETQPGAVQNAGSTFKNPPGDSAGRLVEAAGLKGHRVGRVSVSQLHANFFIADEGAKAQDVYDLVHEVRHLVKERMGVELHPEVRFVGDFASRSA